LVLLGNCVIVFFLINLVLNIFLIEVVLVISLIRLDNLRIDLPFS
jgi:hypothetical protein